MMSFAKISFLFLTFLFFSCSDGIVSECPEEEQPKVASSFSAIEPEVFGKTCALSGCHTGNNPQAGLNLTPGSAYGNTVDVLRPFDTKYYIKSGSSTESFLFSRISATDATRMPPPPNAPLPQAVIDSIKAWIDNGALNN